MRDFDTHPTVTNTRETVLQVGDVILFHGLKGQEIASRFERHEVIAIRIDGKVILRTMDTQDVGTKFVPILALNHMLAGGIATLTERTG